MHPFEYVEPRSLEEAVELLVAHPADALPLAGGTDLLSEIKDGTKLPGRLVSLAGIPDLRGMAWTSQGFTIGAMASIADIASHPTVLSNYACLGQTASGLATPQIRHVGTLGGNLCQRPRCWYYRHALTPCLKRGGDRCYALAGNSKYLCVIGGAHCYIVHPSDIAVALEALEATIEIAGPAVARTLPIEEFFIGPGQELTSENILGPGELVTRVHLPEPPSGLRSLYLKAREREGGDFALASVAATVALDDATVSTASVILGGVAPVPYRARRAEEYLRGRPVSEIEPATVGELAMQEATPMADNGYKVVLASNLVKRAITQLLTN